LFFSPNEFDVAVAFLQGFNLAGGSGLLVGFHEWLVVRLGFGNNLVWCELVLHAIFPDDSSPRNRLQEAGMQEFAVNCLFALLAVFAEDKGSRRGLFWILLRHQQWLESQDWCCPSSPDYIDESQPDQ
jgi:hypothetical protein